MRYVRSCPISEVGERRLFEIHDRVLGCRHRALSFVLSTEYWVLRTKCSDVPVLHAESGHFFVSPEQALSTQRSRWGKYGVRIRRARDDSGLRAAIESM